MGTPHEEVTTPPEPTGQNSNQDILPDTPRYPRYDCQSPDRYSWHGRVGQYV